MLIVPSLSDDVVRLRDHREDDVEAMVRGCDDPDVARFTLTVPSPYTRADAEAFLAGEAAMRERDEGFTLACADPLTDEWIGNCGISHLDPEHLSAEVGYLVASWARGRGVATHAIRLLGPWALRELGLERLQLRHDVTNAGSARVAEAAGFVREGVHRNFLGARGRRWDVAVWSLVRTDLGIESAAPR